MKSLVTYLIESRSNDRIINQLAKLTNYNTMFQFICGLKVDKNDKDFPQDELEGFLRQYCDKRKLDEFVMDLESEDFLSIDEIKDLYNSNNSIEIDTEKDGNILSVTITDKDEKTYGFEIDDSKEFVKYLEMVEQANRS